MNLDSPEFKAVMFASTVLHAQGRCREAISTVETELPKMLPECLPVAYLGIIWAAENASLSEKAREYALKLKLTEPSHPAVARVLG